MYEELLSVRISLDEKDLLLSIAIPHVLNLRPYLKRPILRPHMI